MVQAACKAKGTDKFLKATIDPFGNFILEGTWTADKNTLFPPFFLCNFSVKIILTFYRLEQMKKGTIFRRNILFRL